MPISDDDYETIEDTISDFDYFYDEEESFKRNRKIIFRYKMMSIGIVILMSIVLITVIGIVRMKMYKTNNILTKNEILKVEYKNTSEDIKEYASAFMTESIPDIVTGVSLYPDYMTLSANLNVDDAYENLSNYYYLLDTDAEDAIKLPKDTETQMFSSYNEQLRRLLQIEMGFIEELQNNTSYSSDYEASSSGDNSWAETWIIQLNSQALLVGMLYPFA